MSIEQAIKQSQKTYRALRHDIIRAQQKNNESKVHHPDEKTKQIKKFLKIGKNLKILELFSGVGNLTQIYEQYGVVFCNELNRNKYGILCEKFANDCIKLNRGDAYKFYHKLIADGQIFDVVDVDSYGFPSRFFPDIFKLITDGYMFLTFPKPYVNILNGITQQHLTCYYGSKNPNLEQIKQSIKNYALCHWRNIEFLDVIDCKSVWRLALKVTKVKATEFTGVRNR